MTSAPALMRLGVALSMLLASSSIALEADRESDELEWTRLAEQIQFLLDHRQDREARDMAKRLVALSQRRFGTKDLRTASALELHGKLYAASGKLVQALHAYQRALAIMEHVLGERDARIADVVIVIAQLYGQAGEPSQAEASARRALAIYEAVGGTAHPKVAEVLVLLAKIYVSQGRPDEARVSYQRAVEIVQQTTDDPDIAPVLVVVAEFGSAHGHPNDAETCYQRLLAIQERALGPTHPDVAVTLGQLAQVLVSRGRLDEAESLRRRAEAIRQHPTTHRSETPASSAPTASRHQALERYADSLVERSSIYVALGEHGEAERLFQEALKMYRDVYGGDNAKIEGLLRQHAEVLQRDGRLKEAQALTQRADQLESAPPSSVSVEVSQD